MDPASTSPMAGASSNRVRRRLIPVIDARFQWKYTLLIVALGVSVSAFMGALLYRVHNDNTKILDLEGNRFLQEQVIQQDQIFLLYLIVGVIVMGLALAIWGLLVTHRISGPLYIVARYLGVLASGRYPDVRPLRKRDELQEFFVIFEEAVNGLRERDLRMLQELNEVIDSDADAEALKAQLKTLRVKLRDALGSAQGVEID